MKIQRAIHRAYHFQGNCNTERIASLRGCLLRVSDILLNVKIGELGIHSLDIT